MKIATDTGGKGRTIGGVGQPYPVEPKRAKADAALWDERSARMKAEALAFAEARKAKR